MVAAAAGLPDLVPVPVVRGADSGDLEHAPTADGVDDTCVLAVIRVVTSGECRCFRCLASLNRLNGRSPRVFVRPASAWLLLPSSAADTGDSAAAGLPKMPKNMKNLHELFSFRIFEICMRTGCTSFASHCRYAPRLTTLWTPPRCLLPIPVGDSQPRKGQGQPDLELQAGHGPVALRNRPRAVPVLYRGRHRGDSFSMT